MLEQQEVLSVNLATVYWRHVAVPISVAPIQNCEIANQSAEVLYVINENKLHGILPLNFLTKFCGEGLLVIRFRNFHVLNGVTISFKVSSACAEERTKVHSFSKGADIYFKFSYSSMFSMGWQENDWP